MRERVFKAIRYNKPDRVPLTHAYLPAALLKHGQNLINLYKRYPNDFYPVEIIKVPERKKEFYKDGVYYREYTDEWGCRWAEHIEGITGQVIAHPLSDWKALDNYHIPNPIVEIERMRDSIDELKGNDYPIWGVTGTTLFERLQWLRGYENIMVDLVENDKRLHTLADMIVEGYMLPFVKKSIEYGAEIIGTGDDWGTQSQLIIPPRIWRSFFKPRYKKIFDMAHSGGAMVWFHTDGYTMEIIEDLIEIGVDVLNPQFSCMDLKELARVTRHKVCIASDIDRQHILPFGRPEEVREYVRQVMELMAGPEGGFIASGEVGPDVPLENVEAMFKAFLEFGKYY